MDITQFYFFIFFILSCSSEKAGEIVTEEPSQDTDHVQEELSDCDEDSCFDSSDCDSTDEEDEEDTMDVYDPTLVGDSQSGSSLYLSKCSGCHGSSALGSSGPSLQGAVQEQDDEELWNIILEGTGDMPAINLQPQKVADIVAWLRSIFP